MWAFDRERAEEERMDFMRANDPAAYMATVLYREKDEITQLDYMIKLREKIEKGPPIKEEILSAVSTFVEFLARDENPELQLQAARALTDIASGTTENTLVVTESEAVPEFVKLLGSPSDDVRKQAILALGNIAGDSPSCRDLVLDNGALTPLLELLNEDADMPMMKIASWILSIFCKGKPPRFELLIPALPWLKKFLIPSNDEEVITNACLAISYLYDGKDANIKGEIEAGVCPLLVPLLSHDSPEVLFGTLRTVGTLVSGGSLQPQNIIGQEHTTLLKLLGHKYESIKTEVCLVILNITAGNNEQIQAEATLVISEATSDQIKYLVGKGCIRLLCRLLHQSNRIFVSVLGALENILKVGEDEKNLRNEIGNPYTEMIDKKSFTKIVDLQNHVDEVVYEKSLKLLQTYWDVVAKGDDDEAMPAEDGAQTGF